MKNSKIGILLLVLALSPFSLLSSFAQNKYFLNTTRYSTDGGNSMIHKTTQFTIDIDNSELVVLESGVSTEYTLLNVDAKPDEIKSDGVMSNTVFECVSPRSKIKYLFIISHYRYNNGALRVSMTSINMISKKQITYLK